MLITILYREVNEDNVLIRNILGEFEDSLKYVSKPTDLMDASSGLLSPVSVFSSFCWMLMISSSQSSLSHSSHYYCGLLELEYDDSMHCKHAFSEVQADLIFTLD